MTGGLCYDDGQTGYFAVFTQQEKINSPKRADNLSLYRKEKERDDGMAAFFSEFFYELTKLIILAAVSVTAIFCGKKLRDRKDAKKASEENSN